MVVLVRLHCVAIEHRQTSTFGRGSAKIFIGRVSIWNILILSHPAVEIEVKVIGICEAGADGQEIKEGCLVGTTGCVQSFALSQIVICLHLLILIVLLVFYQNALQIHWLHINNDTHKYKEHDGHGRKEGTKLGKTYPINKGAFFISE